MDDLELLAVQAREEFAAATNSTTLEEAKARYLGKSGSVTQALKAMASLSPEEKKARGAAINTIKTAIEESLFQRRQVLAEAQLQAQLSAEALDVTLPGRGSATGSIHPISRTMERVEQIFGTMGFAVADGPEIENDWYSFTSLNSPLNHPARSMQDTFYVDMNDENGQPLVLRPHTSPMQVRYATARVQEHESLYGAGTCNGNAAKGTPRMADIRVIAPGRVFRVDNDATHSPMFHQCEGLWLGQNVSFRDLKSILGSFFRSYFESNELQLQFRPSYFPFTEPSAEIDIAFASGPKKGKWLEVGGCGQVHPTVVRNFGLDPEEWIGFAFGMGIDRLSMLRYGVNDLRQFFEGDIRFLSQFAE